MAVAEEAIVSGKRRGVSGFQDEMLRLVDERFLATCVATPEQEDKMIAMFVEVFDGGFSENLPAFAAVRTGFMRFNSENVIEEQNALFLPGFKIASLVRMRAIFGVDFFIDIDERRRDGLRVGDRKGEAMRGAGSMVGILAENDDFYGV